MRKGIVLAGGLGTRLYPCTEVVSKQLLPVYDKPLIYYSISTLMMADIREILVISSLKDKKQFQDLLKDGNQWGIKINYAHQEQPNGIAECFRIGESFIEKDNVSLILGDNIFYGNELTKRLKNASNTTKGCSLFAYHTSSPEQFGVIKFENKEPVEIIEKPKYAPSNYAVTGLYFYDNKVVDYSYDIEPSSRGELEITDINNIYLKNKDINLEYLNRGIAWMDTGTFESLSEASSFVGTIQRRTGTMISCLEEIAFNKKWISKKQLKDSIDRYHKSDYGKYLQKIMVQK